MITPCSYISALKPYQAGKPIAELARELGLEDIIKLASNERPITISQSVKKAITAALANIERYPDNNGFALKQALAKYLSKNLTISDEQIILGSGSSNILQLAAHICICKSSDEIIFSEYAFALYRLISQSLGAKSVCVASWRYGHNLDKMQAAISENTKLIYIANPNNPTGTFLSDKAIYRFLVQVPKFVLVVLDEAYFEYVADYQTLAFLEEFDNLLITRTFSKAYGLAGLRIGYGVGNRHLIDYLNRIRAPFNVSEIAQKAALAALEDKESLKQTLYLNRQGLAQLEAGIAALGLFYITSKANFLTVAVTDSQAVYEFLLKKGLIIRVIEVPGFIRISVGNKAQNQALLSALAQYYDVQ